MRRYSVPTKPKEHNTSVGVLHVPENDGPREGLTYVVFWSPLCSEYLCLPPEKLLSQDVVVRTIKEPTLEKIWDRYDEIVRWLNSNTNN
jgi:hypothetical protein